MKEFLVSFGQGLMPFADSANLDMLRAAASCADLCARLHVDITD